MRNVSLESEHRAEKAHVETTIALLGSMGILTGIEAILGAEAILESVGTASHRDETETKIPRAIRIETRTTSDTVRTATNPTGTVTSTVIIKTAIGTRDRPEMTEAADILLLGRKTVGTAAETALLPSRQRAIDVTEAKETIEVLRLVQTGEIVTEKVGMAHLAMKKEEGVEIVIEETSGMDRLQTEEGHRHAGTADATFQVGTKGHRAAEKATMDQQAGEDQLAGEVQWILDHRHKCNVALLLPDTKDHRLDLGQGVATGASQIVVAWIGIDQGANARDL